MKYQITCEHCGTRFLVEGKGGQTIECQCPGCEGTMRATLPKTQGGKAGDDSNAPDISDDTEYQMGSVPPSDNGSDNGGDNHQRRRLALGCFFALVIIAAAVVAFFALNHTVKKPIDDPYEYVEPDTAMTDTIPEEETEEPDTVIVHEEDTVPERYVPDTTGHAEEALPSEEEPSEEQTEENGENHKAEPSKDAGSGDEPTSKSKTTKQETVKQESKSPAN